MTTAGLTRRTLLRGAGVCVAASALPLAAKSENSFLDDLSYRSFRFFEEATDPHTGVTADRMPRDGSTSYRTGSIAATGFSLAAFCIASERGWMNRQQARERVRKTLQFFKNDAPREHGWFYHFMDVSDGRRSGTWSELSSIDTALLIAGVLTARGYFTEDAEIRRLATELYDGVDFDWMLNGHPTLLSHGWTPERGFIHCRWDQYNELTILNLLGIGSRTHRMTPDSWYAWGRPENVYENFRFIGKTPLFTYQYSHAFVDYRGRPEQGSTLKVDWFQNSVIATRANRQFCMNLSKDFPTYSGDVWGITCSDSAKGYQSWGGVPSAAGIEGTVVPCAAGGSLMFAPEICLPTLKAMHENFGEKIYGRYGFADAFQPANGWVSRDVLGIDVGITLLSAENLQSGNIWKWFMRSPEIVLAMQLAGM